MLIPLFLVIFIHSTHAIPIDNGVEGEPDIECGATSITVSFKTKSTFEGKVYVRGHVTESACVNQDRGRNEASLNLPFQTCGLLRTRSLNPKGVFVTASVVISFHAQFLTKVDKAYTIQCFYMEAEKTVSQAIEVSELSTSFQTQIAPMPVCRYEILEGGPTGNPVRFATVGQQVYHKWTCDTQTTDTFCMTVHSCVVEDGVNNKVQILADNGCALDRFILQNLEYTTDLMAGREAHVFKFADQPALFFQCQISITIKEPGQQCPRPQCPDTIGVIGGSSTITRPPDTNPKNGKPSVKPIPQPIPVRSQLPPAYSPTPAPTTVPPVAYQPTAAANPPSVLAATSVRLSYLAATRVPFDFGRTANVFDSPLDDFDRKRRARAVSNEELGVWDVRSQLITAFELDDNSDSALPTACNRNLSETYFYKPINGGVYCFSSVSFSLGICFALISFISSSLLCCIYMMKRWKNFKCFS